MLPARDRGDGGADRLAGARIGSGASLPGAAQGGGGWHRPATMVATPVGQAAHRCLPDRAGLSRIDARRARVVRTTSSTFAPPRGSQGARRGGAGRGGQARHRPTHPRGEPRTSRGGPNFNRAPPLFLSSSAPRTSPTPLVPVRSGHGSLVWLRLGVPGAAAFWRWRWRWRLVPELRCLLISTDRLTPLGFMHPGNFPWS